MAINRKNDYAFKRIFGHEDTKDVLARFLTVVLEIPIEPEELTLVHTEFSPEYIADKASRLDIHVRRSASHEKMVIEMQVGDEGNIERRTLYYWSKGYAEELKEKQDYATLPRMINIVILDFDVFKWNDNSKFHGVFRVLEHEEAVLFSDALEIHTLELPKLKRQPPKAEWSPLECWGLYLSNMEGEVMERIAEQEPMVRRAITIEDIFMKNEEERHFYEIREKNRRDYYNAISTYEKRGLQKGKQEGKQEVALLMLQKNTPVEFIQEVTGLSEEEIMKNGKLKDKDNIFRRSL
ncbi:MAG: Rpn family recombination-promoting nuclease/putative transposase [Synergistaceae bacterium]|nr:Rpn family recombination-promoting nuclease/putative transposase [Synergistaceae bacterium]